MLILKPLILVLLLYLAACGPTTETPRSPTTTHQVQASDATARFGSLEWEDQAFSRIADASLSPSGRFVVVLDEAPPFVHVFDRSAGESWNFGARGEGPGELRRPYSLEVVGDTTLLLLSNGRFDVFDIHGNWLRGRPLNEFGVLASALAVGCDGRLFVYGAPPDSWGSDTVTWLHELRWDSVPRRRSLLEIAGPVTTVAFGGPPSLHATDVGILLWHRNAPARSGWWLPCSTLEPERLTSRTSEAADGETRVFDNGRTEESKHISDVDTLFSGAAVADTTPILGRRWGGFEAKARTALEFHTREGCTAVELSGHWTLFDATPSELLLGHTDLYPEAWIVPRRLIAEWTETGRCTI